MIIRCAHTRIAKISDLKLNPENRNVHPQDQIKQLADILKYQGWRYCVKVSKQTGMVTSGHGRVEAALLNGWNSVPVDDQDYDTPEQEYADTIADNAIASWSELNLDGIHKDLKNLPNLKVDLLGIKDFTMVDIEVLAPQCDEDEVPEHVEPKTKIGDLYHLGSHRLLCGDSTSIDAVDKLMNGEKADITFTSPPYNAAKNGHLTGHVSGFDRKYQKENSDELSDDDYLNLLSGFTSIAIAKSRYCFVNIQLLTHNRQPLFKYQEQFQSLIKDVLIWNKKQCPPNIVKGAFNTKWEYIFCFSEDRKTRGFPCDWQGQFPNVIETESNASNEFADTHKAGFPVALPNWFIEKFDFAKTIYDPFGGTGTTIIACEKTNRKCFMMELDPVYCDVIVARWEKYTGKKAELMNGPTQEGN